MQRYTKMAKDISCKDVGKIEGINGGSDEQEVADAHDTWKEGRWNVG